MIKITFLLLVHQKPRLAQRLIALLIEAGHTVAVHYDKKAPDAEYEQLRTAFAGSPHVCFARRVEVGWGHWTIVQAAIEGIDAIRQAGWQPDYVYHISGADYPIRPASDLIDFLQRNAGKNFIEGVPADSVIWVKGGPQRERYLYRHYFSWRERRRLSQNAMHLQRALRLQRRFVGGMTPYIGSQWWLLPWKTLDTILEVGRRPEVMRFFKSTLIPDELYFQTLVFNLIPRAEIVERSPTLNQFSDYMVPVMYTADATEYLMRQPFFFARKMSPHRPELSDKLDKVWRGEHTIAPFPDKDFGRISLEYEVTRVAQRDGLPGVPVVGRVPIGRMEQLLYVKTPFFGVVGTSSAELKFAHALLSGQDGIVCHGQLFHPAAIEFARDARQNGGYGARQVVLRDASTANFLADMIRVAAPRQMGFLLRFGQGWEIQDILFEHAYAHVLVLYGDPLVGFIESLADIEPRLSDALNSVSLQTIPPSIIVARFKQYMQSLHRYRLRVSDALAKAKRKGTPPSWSWLVELDLDVTKPPLVVPRRGMRFAPEPDNRVQATLSRWRDWLEQASLCLGIDLDRIDHGDLWSRFATELKMQESNRAFLIELFKAGGHDLLAPRLPEPLQVAAQSSGSGQQPQ